MAEQRESKGLRRALERYLPLHFRDPVGLALRLLRSGSPDAGAAAFQAVLGAAAAPLDLLLRPLERARLERAEAPAKPILFVAGPPRSGTTLVAQTLIHSLRVAYLTNLTGIFPRAPITAGRLFRARLANEKVRARSHYGRTSRIYGPNDGLQLWDRWVGGDRTRIPAALGATERLALNRFFGAYEQEHRRPLVAKNNSLNLFAALVADALPTACFVCLRREPLFLAQSLLQARRHIHGTDTLPYGPHSPDRDVALSPIDDVCAQIRFHEDTARQQQQAIGAERFRFLSYEAFCADPAAFVMETSEKLGLPREAHVQVPPLQASRRRTLPAEEFAELERAVERAGLGDA
ncbi:MAG: sulfotransferase [Myxococcota bacterium]